MGLRPGLAPPLPGGRGPIRDLTRTFFSSRAVPGPARRIGSRAPSNGGRPMTTSAPDVKSIFGRALEIESPAARAAYLEEACGTNAGLRAEIEVLVRYHGKVGEFMGRPLAADATEDYETITERPGT